MRQLPVCFLVARSISQFVNPIGIHHGFPTAINSHARVPARNVDVGGDLTVEEGKEEDADLRTAAVYTSVEASASKFT